MLSDSPRLLLLYKVNFYLLNFFMLSTAAMMLRLVVIEFLKEGGTISS